MVNRFYDKLREQSLTRINKILTSIDYNQLLRIPRHLNESNSNNSYTNIFLYLTYFFARRYHLQATALERLNLPYILAIG